MGHIEIGFIAELPYLYFYIVILAKTGQLTRYFRCFSKAIDGNNQFPANLSQ